MFDVVSKNNVCGFTFNKKTVSAEAVNGPAGRVKLDPEYNALFEILTLVTAPVNGRGRNVDIVGEKYVGL